MSIKVTVWGEFRHEKKNATVAEIYPNGMHEAIASHLRKAGGLEIRTAVLDDAEHGLSEEVLSNTDVFTWWGHLAHKDVDDRIVDRVHERVLAGAGIVVLHSGHMSKIFRKLMGTTCNLKWREEHGGGSGRAEPSAAEPEHRSRVVHQADLPPAAATGV